MHTRGNLLTALFFLMSYYSFSQDGLPSYPKVLKSFLTKYVALQEYEYSTSFA